MACMGVLACACVRAGSSLPFVPFIVRRAGTEAELALCTIYCPSCWNMHGSHLLRDRCVRSLKLAESKAWLKTVPPSLPEDP